MLLLALLLATAALASAQPAPSPNLPALPMGPNDLVSISVYDAPELTRTVRISSDGFIRLPMLQQRLRAQDLLPHQLEAAIAAALRDEQLLVDPVVTVNVAEYHSRPISVAGAVRRPLTFQAAGPVTLLDAVTRAEGLTELAGPEILVTKTGLTRRVLVKALIDAADPDSNLQLTGGEEIRVPEVGRIFVVGNVKRPGAFPVQGSSETTVLQMLALAEGLMPYANKQAYIYRREASGSKNEIPIELDQIMKRKSPDVPLLANDILYIPDNKGRRSSLAVLEKILIFGTGASTALIYGAAVR